MKVNIETNISKNFNSDVTIKIETSEYTKEVINLIEMIQDYTKEVDTILGRKNNEISIIKVDDILNVYSIDSKTYCKTNKGDYIIKPKLYELEETLSKKDFIRISNSLIANIKYVECFDIGTIGDIVVKFTDGTKEKVAKRRISEVKKFLNDRR